MYQEIFKKQKPTKDNLIYILHDIQNCSPQQYITEETFDEGKEDESEYLVILSGTMSKTSFYPLEQSQYMPIKGLISKYRNNFLTELNK